MQEANNMKYIKIILILALLLIPVYSYSTGTITSGDIVVTFEQAEPNSLNEWFYNLSLSEKIDIYNYWSE
jgi:hypothetical protein